MGSSDSGGLPKLVVVGRISGLFGVRGWVKVFSDTSPRTNILRYERWYLQRSDNWTAFDLAAGRAHGKGIVARLDGLDDRDQAAGLIGAKIAVPREALPPAQPNEYYWTDLQGLQVVTLEGVVLGRVDYLFETGANDVMVVSGERERMLPFVAGVIAQVDLDQARISVDWDPEF